MTQQSRPFATLDDMDVRGRVVLLRADLNVPVQDGKILDTTRIDRLQPTIAALHARGAKTVIMSHFGRPKGIDPSQGLAQLCPALTTSWELPVTFAADCIGPIAATAITAMQDGDLLLLENLRFHAGEEANDPDFVTALAALGDLYINDAFATAHRAHASTTGLATRLPAAAGYLMTAELDALTAALESPRRPVCALIGGSKISSKLALLDNLVQRVDILILGGAMANTFLLAQGATIGRSLAEPDMVETARQIMARAAAHSCRIILPIDGPCAASLSDLNPVTHPANAVPADLERFDIGPASMAAFCDAIRACHTLIWNGPVGVYETPLYAAGSLALARCIADRVKGGNLCAIAGGGDTVAVLEMANLADAMTYVSTAGGAFLEWLEGKTLPGVAALIAAHQA